MITPEPEDIKGISIIGSISALFARLFFWKKSNRKDLYTEIADLHKVVDFWKQQFEEVLEMNNNLKIAFEKYKIETDRKIKELTLLLRK